MKASLLLLATILLYTRTPEHSTVVQGAFINKDSVDKAKQLDWLLLQVKLKVGRTVIAQSTVHPNGHYTISNQSDAKADLVYGGSGVNDDVYLATILPHESDTVKLTSELPVSILKKHGAIRCPKCKQKDKVLPIDGRAGIVMQTSDGQRHPYDKKHYYPDSDVSSWLDPHWYCVRDTIKF